jgi:hypothetical protein
VTGWVALDGPEAERCVVDALERVGSALPYLRAGTGPVAGPARPGTLARDRQWMNCGELLANREWLEANRPQFRGPVGDGLCRRGSVAVRPGLLVPGGGSRSFLHAHGRRYPELRSSGVRRSDFIRPPLVGHVLRAASARTDGGDAPPVP